MKISFEANEYAQNVLSNRRSKAEDLLSERKAALFDADIRIKQAFSDISNIGIEAALASLRGETIDPTNQIKAISDQIKQYLQEDGLPVTYFEDVYTCPICKDKGFINEDTPCECYKKLINKYNMSTISEVSPLKLCTFGTFDINLYSKEPDPDFGISPKENIEENLSVCRSFLKGFGRHSDNLLMLGDSGLGKTHLALSIANELIARGVNVIYCSAPSILKIIETEYFEEHRSMDTLNRLKNCDLLVLDDLGAEFINSITCSNLYDLIDTRFNLGRSTIITSNLTDEGLFSKRYGEKISSRLLGRCKILPFFGDDIRLILNEQ